MSFLSLIFGEWIYKPYSKIIHIILLLKGIKVEKNLYIQGLVKLKIRGKSKDIKIGDTVSINGNIDIRNRENGKIIIDQEVSIDTNLVVLLMKQL